MRLKISRSLRLQGGHGGADDTLFGQLFADDRPDDLPTIYDGLQAVLTGCAVVDSIKSGKRVSVQPDWLKLEM